MLRADFRAFYAMELAQDRPLGVILGECQSGGLTPFYDIGWHLTATHRLTHPLTLEEFLDALAADPVSLILGLVNEAVTPVCPVHEVERSNEPPKRIPWSQLMFEGRHILGWSEDEWWRATFRTQQAQLWEHSRHHDPEGKYGRAMSEEEISSINRRNMALLMGMAGADSNHAKLRAG